MTILLAAVVVMIVAVAVVATVIEAIVMLVKVIALINRSSSSVSGSGAWVSIQIVVGYIISDNDAYDNSGISTSSRHVHPRSLLMF